MFCKRVKKFKSELYVKLFEEPEIKELLKICMKEVIQNMKNADVEHFIEFDQFEIITLTSTDKFKSDINNKFNRAIPNRFIILVSCRTLLEGFDAEWTNMVINLFSFKTVHWEI